MTTATTAPRAIGIFTPEGLDIVCDSAMGAHDHMTDLRGMGFEIPDLHKYEATDESALYEIDELMRDGMTFKQARNRAEAAQAARRIEAEAEAAHAAALKNTAEAEAAQTDIDSAVWAGGSLESDTPILDEIVRESAAPWAAEAETAPAIENRAARAVRWNTGRAYGPEGQPIAARIMGGFAYFHDSARMIMGKIDLSGHDVTRAGLESFVMRAYDAGQYEIAGAFPTWAEAEAARLAEAEAEAEAEAAPEFIDATPTWAAIMPGLIAVLTNGSPEGRAMAESELMRLAHAVDAQNTRGRSLSAAVNPDAAPARPSRATARAEAAARAESLGMAAHALADNARASGGFPLWACNAAHAIDDSIDLFGDYGGPFDSVRYGVGLPAARHMLPTGRA